MNVMLTTGSSSLSSLHSADEASELLPVVSMTFLFC